MRRVVCIIALGLSLGACESFPDNGYGTTHGYYDRGPGRFVREEQCFEVRSTPFSRPYIECRVVKRWKPDHGYAHHKPRYRDRDRDDDYDVYSYREPKRRWRDREYYD